ncbi:MAG: hypothetical protein KIT27_11995 [Legionellales bacterium]|nr:hypothetical protein [Legionellales bacterium]
MALISPSDWPTLQGMLSSIVSNIPDITILISAFSYISGLFFCLRATYALKEYGELRTMMSSQTSLIKPITLYVVGALLLYFPTTYHYAIETFFGQANPTPYEYQSTNYASWDGIISVVIQILEIIGIIAFMRGLFMLSALGGHQSPHGTIGKAFTHIVGGILSMNIVGFSHAIEGTLGITIH